MALYFANSPELLVPDALSGFAHAHRDVVEYDAEHGFLRARHPIPARRVALLSGGGSGHEPLHIGFVGAGMLDAVCPGRVFASPHNRQIFEASRAVAGEAGVLHIVKNYTGDKINFGIAAERLAYEGIPCERVVVDDDVASESEAIAVGRRGMAATVVVEKILGAAADEGRGLAELARLGTDVAARCRSVAVAATAHTVPSTGAPAFDLPVGTLEYGVGIHGEHADRSCPQPAVTDLITDMTATVLSSLGLDRQSSVIAVVNGLGSVTLLELYGIFHELRKVLRERDIVLERAIVGNFLSALDARGFSLTLFATDAEATALWDAPAYTQQWRTR